MSETFTEIVDRLDDLSLEERAELARVVLLSLEPHADEVQDAWELELERRVAAIRNGTAVGIPAEEVFAAWRNSR